ncbi:hypothetical protein BOX15_Mlig022126g1 [Macrostomum lignano]|uniref:Uncharacterized protein n=1 Tax=Macrostomum lignano TaxID=282301 RepID=A0A267GKW1_9PLAT|nr:hypothetical protein BOX15_Mlig022126g1 [Macrostomum lignano]
MASYSLDLKKRVATDLTSGMSVRMCAEKYSVGKSTVGDWKKLLDSGDSLEPKEKSGRPRTVRTPDFMANLEAKRAEDPTKTMRQIAREEGVHESNVRNAFREMGVRSFVQREIPMLNADQLGLRVQRSRRLLNDLKASPGVEVIFFTDEKNFTQTPYRNRSSSRVLARSSEERDAFNSPQIKHPATIMVFGLVASDGKKMQPIFFDKGYRLNGDGYLDVLQKVLHWIRSNYPDRVRPDGSFADGWNFRFQQDSAPAHTRNDVQAWLSAHFGRKRVWLKEDWPAYSPDLNPLDFSIWNQVDKRACRSFHTSLDSLRSAIHEAWESELTPEYLVRCCKAFRGRLEKVIAQGGSPIVD